MCVSVCILSGPVNEDVFVAPAPKPGETKTIDPDVPEITEQIHRLLLQVRDEPDALAENRNIRFFLRC